jgi:long-chain acyl-CoA synthetase
MSEKKNIAKNVGKESWLGRTLPALIYHTKAVLPNEAAFVQWDGTNWKPFSTDQFIDACEELALGLLQIGLSPGDRVALYLESDVYFCLSDMGCLMAGLVNVPIYLTNSSETIEYVLGHADAHAIIVSDRERLSELEQVIRDGAAIHTVIMVDSKGVLERPSSLPEAVQLVSLDAIREKGKAKLAVDSAVGRELSDKIEPSDLATIIYTSGTTGRPKGVMLTHENISSNALMAYAGMVGYRSGQGGETMLSFLPLTHVFARTLYYGALAHGTSIYFSHPDRLVDDLSQVHPTILPTVPRVLEKVYARIIARTEAMSGLSGKIARWGLSRAQSAKKGTAGVFHKTADQFVYKKWRSILGGNIRFVISGGAALNSDIANVFKQAGIEILQGYGLTETSPVIAFNRPNANRLGTVGQPLEWVEVKLAEDGEILTRGPHVMAGYFKDPERTREVIDAEGWFSTGDIGQLSEDGFLTITDRKKDLFKLSTGKYVMPQPLENNLSSEAIIDQSVVIGDGHKFAAALIFPNPEHLRILGRTLGLPANTSLPDLCSNEQVIKQVGLLVDRANEGLPHWSTIKRFSIVPGELTVENELLTPTLKVKRSAVKARFLSEIEALYQDENAEDLQDTTS